MNERIRGTVLVSLFGLRSWQYTKKIVQDPRIKPHVSKTETNFLIKICAAKNRNFFIGQRKKKEKDSAKIKKNEKMEADTACLTTI
mgnify:CR=1 FL=1